MKCATTKHPQTIGKLERTHASLKTNLKMASGDYQRQWHKYLPLAVLNYNTIYHTTLGCEPSKFFHGRIPYITLDHKLDLNTNPKVLPTTDFSDEFQRRTQILLDSAKNSMQPYLKYKEYYDRKAKAAPLKQNDYCFILQPIADPDATETPNGLVDDTTTPGEIFTDVYLRYTGPHENDDFASLEEARSERTNDGIDDQQSSGGSDTTVPKYYMMKRMI